MTRTAWRTSLLLRLVLLVVCGFIAAFPPQARSDELAVLDDKLLGFPPQEMLHRYLLGRCQERFDARRQAVAALKTPEAVQKRQAELRERFIASLGGFPEKTPLNPRIVGIVQRDGYRIEKVVYESRPNHHVTANLYVPESLPGPVPGVLVPCGHSAEGKAAETYHRACVLMAKNGLVVLCYDPIGQGERIQLLDKLGKPAINGSTAEHTMCGIGALLVGRQTASYRIWDGMRSLDYLASRPEVDPAQLGCTGNSGGGTLTAYLMALDERIQVAAPSCYITSLERLFATIGPQDAEQNITGQVAFGMEHADFIAMRAPRPTLVCTATRDFFDIQGSWTTFREAKRLYGLLGHGERVDLFEYDDQHGFSKPRREAACRWMLRWLAGRDEPVVEGDFAACKPSELQCTRTGQVLEEFKGRSVFDLNAQRERELAAGRTERWLARARAERIQMVKKLLGIAEDPTVEKPGTEHRGQVSRSKYVITKSTHETERGVFVPCLTFQRREAAQPRMATLVLVDGGAAREAGPGGLLEQLLKKADVVHSVDLRGLGESAPASAASRAQPPITEHNLAFLGLHLNRPLLGQRCADLLAVLKLHAGMPVDLAATGRNGPIALHAAALSESVRSLTLDGALISWASVVHTPISTNQLASVVPGVLEHYDLPDLAATLAPLPLTIRNPVDAAGKPVSQAELERVYARVREAYARAGAADRLVLEGQK